jgi:hypothetical protein
VAYFESGDVTPDAADAAADAVAAVDEIRCFDGGDDASLEVILDDDTLPVVVADMGVSLRSLTVHPGRCRFEVGVPVGREVRQVVDRLSGMVAEVQLLACRHCDRRPDPAVGRPEGITGELTDRQQEVLEVAYRAGYFSWPRESTAEEVADALDLSPPTLHGHLRKAQGTILAALLDA